MTAHFFCRQLIGANFDIEHATLIGRPQTEQGVALFFSSLALAPSSAQIRQWCQLARAANGGEIDCMVWVTTRGGRVPIGAVRMRFIW